MTRRGVAIDSHRQRGVVLMRVAVVSLAPLIVIAWRGTGLMLLSGSKRAARDGRAIVRIV
jgi:hypothetical protein